MSPPIADVDLMVLGLLFLAWAFMLALGYRVQAMFYPLSIIAGVLFAWEIFLITASLPVTALWFAIVIFIGIFAIFDEVKG